MVAPLGLIFPWYLLQCLRALPIIFSSLRDFKIFQASLGAERISTDLHRPTEEALLPINNHYKMSRKHEDVQYYRLLYG